VSTGIIQDAIFQPEILALNPESNQKSSSCLDSKYHGRFQSTLWIEIQSYTGWYVLILDCTRGFWISLGTGRNYLWIGIDWGVVLRIVSALFRDIS
jgi:hypothetical protein